VRGAFANFYKLLASDLKSIAASGWGPELIPDDDILQSQFPQVLAELEQQHARLAELQPCLPPPAKKTLKTPTTPACCPPTR
jgi:type I restriction enzyme M protein